MAALFIHLFPLWVGHSLAQHGKVDFANSCDPSLHADMNHALTLLYAFEYGDSRKQFDRIIAADPTCCIAYFFAASTFSSPIWSFISPSSLVSTEEYADKASGCIAAPGTRASLREAAYVSALAVYANASASLEPAERLQRYAMALKEKVYLPFASEDEHAAVLYGLALLSVGYYSELEPANGWPHLLEAARIEEAVLATNPDAPGALHFVVHAYDQPAMASHALEAARRLETVADGVPHQLHMPSHIYVDLGFWNESVLANTASLNAAYRAKAISSSPLGDWYHGSYFLQVAMLNLAMDCDAAAFVEVYRGRAKTDPQFFVHGEAISRIPAQFFVETRNWEQAAHFNLSVFYQTGGQTWEGQEYSLIYAGFVATVGRAVLGMSSASVTAACATVEAAHATLIADGSWHRYQLPYYRTSFEVMVRSARAWQRFRAASFADGIEAMVAVVAFQQSSWHPEAGPIWDAHEQLAEMYLIRQASGDTAFAFDAYEAAIAVYPNRYRSLAGAAHTAKVLRNLTRACTYYRRLLALTAAPLPVVKVDGVPPSSCTSYKPDRRPELEVALAFVATEFNIK